MLAKGLFGRLFGYAAFALGFWLLFQGFSQPNIGMAVAGGATILGSMYLMAAARRIDPVSGMAGPASEKEDASSESPASESLAGDALAGDALNRSDQGDKLPP